MRRLIGQGRIFCLVVGDSGIGKSSLIDNLSKEDASSTSNQRGVQTLFDRHVTRINNRLWEFWELGGSAASSFLIQCVCESLVEHISAVDDDKSKTNNDDKKAPMVIQTQGQGASHRLVVLLCFNQNDRSSLSRSLNNWQPCILSTMAVCLNRRKMTSVSMPWFLLVGLNQVHLHIHSHSSLSLSRPIDVQIPLSQQDCEDIARSSPIISGYMACRVSVNDHSLVTLIKLVEDVVTRPVETFRGGLLKQVIDSGDSLSCPVSSLHKINTSIERVSGIREALCRLGSARSGIDSAVSLMIGDSGLTRSFALEMEKRAAWRIATGARLVNLWQNLEGKGREILNEGKRTWRTSIETKNNTPEAMLITSRIQAIASSVATLHCDTIECLKGRDAHVKLQIQHLYSKLELASRDRENYAFCSNESIDNEISILKNRLTMLHNHQMEAGTRFQNTIEELVEALHKDFSDLRKDAVDDEQRLISYLVHRSHQVQEKLTQRQQSRTASIDRRRQLVATVFASLREELVEEARARVTAEKGLQRRLAAIFPQLWQGQALSRSTLLELS